MVFISTLIEELEKIKEQDGDKIVYIKDKNSVVEGFIKDVEINEHSITLKNA